MPRAHGHFIFLFILLSLISCSKKHTPNEELISRQVREAARAAEAKDIKAFLKYISSSYRDPMGNNRDGIKSILLYHFARNERISIYIVKEEIEAGGEKGKAKIKVIFTGEKKPSKEIQELIRSALGIYKFEISFKRERGRWLATSATWTEIGLKELL